VWNIVGRAHIDVNRPAVVNPNRFLSSLPFGLMWLEELFPIVPSVFPEHPPAYFKTLQTLSGTPTDLSARTFKAEIEDR
jgi:hypothetical protein